MLPTSTKVHIFPAMPNKQENMVIDNKLLNKELVIDMDD